MHGGIKVISSFKVVNDFKEDLAYGDDPGHEAFWADVYRRVFPNFQSCMQTPGKTPSQKRGTDRVIMLTNGLVLKIQEKARREVQHDMLLEYISNDRTGSPGWIEQDLEINYIAYAFMSVRRAHVIPWQPLHTAWQQNKAVWMAYAENEHEGFRKIPARNRTYTTYSVAVPWRHIFSAVARAGYVQL